MYSMGDLCGAHFSLPQLRGEGKRTYVVVMGNVLSTMEGFLIDTWKVQHMCSGADPRGVDGVASHPRFTCSFVHGTMGIGQSMLASHPP